MLEKSVIVIGAGIAGLSAGCYAQMNGYRTRIFEMHTIPGGLCTAWKRKGYTIDSCIHWLVGSKPGRSMNRYWQEVGMVQGREFLDLEEFVRVEDEQGRTLSLYTDLDRLEQHLLELAPEDEKLIREFVSAARRLVNFDSPPDRLPGMKGMLEYAGEMLKLVPALPVFPRWGKLSMGEFSARFKNPFLRQAMASTWGEDFPVIAFMMTLAWLHDHNAGYPIGGSLPLALAVEKRFKDLGGEIHYGSRVEQILTEGGRAVGIRLADGREERADIVISAADGHATIFNMLDGRYLDDRIRGYYDHYKLFPPIVYLALGVKRSFDGEPQIISGTVFSLDEPLRVGDKDLQRLEVRIQNYDPTLAPRGHSVIYMILETGYEYWKDLYAEDRERYDAEKQELALRVIRRLEKRYPGLEADVEMVDVATPVTFESYTGNWRASWEGWLPTPDNLMARMSRTLPGLENFYMVGQWVQPGGGLPSGVMTGREVVGMICKQDGRRFSTSLPSEKHPAGQTALHQAGAD